jgi:hypothetical protein
VGMHFHKKHRKMPILFWITTSNSFQVMLEEGFYTYIDEDWAEELVLAVEVLEWLRLSV